MVKLLKSDIKLLKKVTNYNSCYRKRRENDKFFT